MSKTFCIEPDCGAPSDGTRCPNHQVVLRRRSYARERIYTQARWKHFSKRLRDAQGFCDYELGNGAVCGDTRDLVCDHQTVEAYERHRRGLPFRIGDFRVVCRYHHGLLGSPGDRT